MTGPDDSPGPGPQGLRSVAAIVLAAGLSRRFGSTASKLLCLWKGRPIISHTVGEIIASGVSRVVVVVGHQGEEIARALDGQKVELVKNAAPADGMSSSLIAGIQSIREGDRPDGVMICLGDMPLIKSSLIADLIGQFSKTQNPSIWRPLYQDAPGHPVIFSTGLFDDLSGIQGDMGARHIIESNSHLVHFLPVKDHSVLFDVDTQKSLDQLRVMSL